MKVAKVCSNAVIPTVKHCGDAGMDVYACGDYVIKPNSFAVLNTGVKIEFPEGSLMLIKPKSRSNFLIGAGVVDQNYQGEILVKIYNGSNFDLIIRHGDAIAQLIFVAYYPPVVREVPLDDIHNYETNRGATGGIVNQVVSMDLIPPSGVEYPGVLDWLKE